MFRPNLISMDFIILSLGNDSLNTPILTNRCILYNCVTMLGFSLSDTIEIIRFFNSFILFVCQFDEHESGFRRTVFSHESS